MFALLLFTATLIHIRPTRSNSVSQQIPLQPADQNAFHFDSLETRSPLRAAWPFGKDGHLPEHPIHPRSQTFLRRSEFPAPLSPADSPCHPTFHDGNRESPGQLADNLSASTCDRHPEGASG